MKTLRLSALFDDKAAAKKFARYFDGKRVGELLTLASTLRHEDSVWYCDVTPYNLIHGTSYGETPTIEHNQFYQYVYDQLKTAPDFSWAVAGIDTHRITPTTIWSQRNKRAVVMSETYRKTNPPANGVIQPTLGIAQPYRDGYVWWPLLPH